MNMYMDGSDEKVINKSVRLILDDDICKALDKQKAKLKKLSKPTVAYEKETKSIIKKLLLEKDIPLSWLEPLYNTTGHEYVDLPLGDGIHIEIEDEVLTQNTTSIYSDSGIFEDGEIPKEYKIVITRDISTQNLINFIKTHSVLLSKLQNNLKLPKDPSIGSKLTFYAAAVIKLKDEGKKSFDEISTILVDAISKDETMSKSEKEKRIKSFADAESLEKNIYNRFKKKYFLLKKTTEK